MSFWKLAAKGPRHATARFRMVVEYEDEQETPYRDLSVKDVEAVLSYRLWKAGFRPFKRLTIERVDETES